MKVVSNANDDAATLQRYAKVAGVLLLLSAIGGGFGEFYAPTTLIVANDATATAHNFIAHDSLFRWGFAAYLLEGFCDTALSLVFYVLLKPVNRNVALLAAFFGLISTATFAVCQVFYFAPSFILGGADYLKTFSPDQLNSLALLSIKYSVNGATLFMAFYGIASFIRGYLMYRSGYLPKFLGALLAVAGLGFVAKTFSALLIPTFPSDVFLMPMPLMLVVLTVWFLVKGIDVKKWEAIAAT